MITTIRAVGVSKTTPDAVAERIQTMLKAVIPGIDKVTWVDTLPRRLTTDSPRGMIGIRQKKWDGTFRIAARQEHTHEAIFAKMEAYSITMGLSVLCCQVSNSEGKQFQTKQAIA